MEPLNHQREALNEIVSRARAYFRGDWLELPVQPRWASLMVGPTGAGKSAVAADIARQDPDSGRAVRHGPFTRLNPGGNNHTSDAWTPEHLTLPYR